MCQRVQLKSANLYTVNKRNELTNGTRISKNPIFIWKADLEAVYMVSPRVTEKFHKSDSRTCTRFFWTPWKFWWVCFPVFQSLILFVFGTRF